ncbi:DAZ interacting zinc finger protein 1 [Oratosquilla oratoria]|uniref:DAZ interacting zinc finger protein 1 n=1 Tax=Oratosquilla oratoria TaxID=337810 RepID=UPI003F7617AB
MRTHLGAVSPAGGAMVPSMAEFPAHRRERVDWQKLASIDLHDLQSSCDMEVLQENLSHVTFCDATSEFDLDTVSGQKNLLKMFRLGQLIIQYLFLSQEYIENQLQEVYQEWQQTKEKYTEVKNKLIQQVGEAKKMKESNRSMRETVKYINSVAAAKGLVLQYKCPLCPKTFRGEDFLRSHLWRKHPEQADAITIPKPAGGKKYFSAADVNEEVMPDKPERENPPQPDEKSERLMMMEEKLDTMNENFSKVMKEMEEQKSALQAENTKKTEEVKQAWVEKNEIERKYRDEIDDINNQLEELKKNFQNNEKEEHQNQNEELLQLIAQQDKEIQFLRQTVENPEQTPVEPCSKDEDTVAQEIAALKEMIGEEKKSHKHALKQMKSALRKEYEEALANEKEKLELRIKELASNNDTQIPFTKKKPPPSPKAMPSPQTPSKFTKPKLVHSVESVTDSGKSPVSKTLTDSSKSPVLKTPVSRTYDGASDTDTDSSEEEEKPANGTYENTIITKVVGQENDKVEEVEKSLSEAEEDTTNDTSPEETSGIYDLETLLEENPHLWKQMHKATSEVLATRLNGLGIEPEAKGIKKVVYSSCMARLRKDRSLLQRKYDNFLDLRKRISSELDLKVSEKKLKEMDISGIEKLDTTNDSSYGRKDRGMFSKMVKNVRSKVKEGSKALSSSVTRKGETVSLGLKGMFHTSRRSSRSSQDAEVISVEKTKVDVSDEIHTKSSSEESSESEDDSSDEDIKDVTAKSVARNLFGDDDTVKPVPGSSGFLRRGSYFDNKMYGQNEQENGRHEDSEWDSDSDHEYVNVKKTEPPMRVDSLDLHGSRSGPIEVVRNGWQADDSDYKPIKVKKPVGEMVSSLSKTIEKQLSGRHASKMAGAVDVMGLSSSPIASSTRIYEENDDIINEVIGSPHGSQQQLSTVSDSVRTSLWGSAETAESTESKVQAGTYTGKKSRNKLVSSWDSEDDLEISDLE